MNEISLKEHLEFRLNAQQELFNQKLICTEQALRLQAVEYERRLNVLNHAHEEAVRVQHTYVTQDKFETWQAVVDKVLQTSGGAEEGKASSWRLTIQVVSFISIILATLINTAVLFLILTK